MLKIKELTEQEENYIIEVTRPDGMSIQVTIPKEGSSFDMNIGIALSHNDQSRNFRNDIKPMG